MRKYTSSHRPLKPVCVTTEYQARFLPPHCHMTVVSTTKEKKPYHSLKGTSVDITTFRSFYVTHKRMKHPPKPPRASVPPKVQRRRSSTPPSPVGFSVNQLVSKVDDYTSVYRSDFRAKTQETRRLSRSSNVNQRPDVSGFLPKEEGHCQKDHAQVEGNSDPVPQQKNNRHPFESTTSYRSDYVAHSLPPRAQEASRGPASCRPKQVWNINQELVDGASEFYKDLNNWSLDNKLTDDRTFLSTTHEHYTAHRCPRTKPILPVINTERSKEPLQAVTTMREDYKAWDTPCHVPVHAPDMARKTDPLSAWGPTPAGGPAANQKPSQFISSRGAADKPCRPAENRAFSGFHCVSSEKGESCTYWSTCVDRAVTWPEEDSCEEPPKTRRAN